METNENLKIWIKDTFLVYKRLTTLNLKWIAMSFVAYTCSSYFEIMTITDSEQNW